MPSATQTECEADVKPGPDGVAHVGGMVRAVIRHRPINWTFHWQGICRAIRPMPASLERGREKSDASPIAINTSTPQDSNRNEHDLHDRSAAYIWFVKVPKLSGEVNDKKPAQGSP
jgi:hypothetical protein